MMSWKKLVFSRWLAVLLLCHLTACALQPEQDIGFDEKLAKLQGQSRFGAAERLIDSADPEMLGTEQREQLRTANSKAARQYEQAIIDEANILSDEESWGDAMALYETARSVFPESDRLFQEADKLLIKRDRYLRHQLLAHRVLRAKRLPEELENLQRISDASQSPKYIGELARLQAEADDVAEALLSSGQKLIARKEWRDARAILALAGTLKEDERIETALRVAQSNIKPRRKNTPKPVVAATPEPDPEPVVDQEAVAKALQQFQSALQGNDFVSARQHLDTARQLDPDNDQVKQLMERLRRRTQTTVEQHIEQGKYQYSLGEIDQAINHWETAYELAPDNEALRERLLKARRFRDRYEQLKKMN